MSREDVESHPSHSRSRSCEAPGRPSVVDFLQGSMPPPEKRSLPPADGFSLSPVSAYRSACLDVFGRSWPHVDLTVALDHGPEAPIRKSNDLR
jgi:hypothetical protein